MNCSVYLFGNLGNGYTAYLNDYTRSLHEAAYSHCRSQILIYIHRDGDLIHYSYVKPLKGASYFGISLVFNSYQAIDISFLVDIFESSFSDIVLRGEIIKFDDKGAIIPTVSDINTKKEEVIRIVDRIRSQIVIANDKFIKLPLLNYATSTNEILSLSINDGNDAVNRAIKNYHNISVYLGANIALLNGYATTLKNLSKKNQDLSKEISDTQIKLKNVEAQKKRTTIVAFLIIAILIIAGLGYSYYQSSTRLGLELDQTRQDLEMTQNELSQARSDINEKNQTILAANRDIAALKNDITDLQEDIEKKSKMIAQLNSTISSKDSELRSAQRKITDRDNTIKDRDTQIATLRKQLSNTKVTSSDFTLKLFDVSHSGWVYNNKSDRWFIIPQGKEKSNSFIFYVLYKGDVIATQKISVNYKK